MRGVGRGYTRSRAEGQPGLPACHLAAGEEGRQARADGRRPGPLASLGRLFETRDNGTDWNLMGSSSRRYPTLLEYLAERDFLPQSQGPWFDHQAEGDLIRVVYCPVTVFSA